MQEKLDFLLEKYMSEKKTVILKDDNCVVVNGREIPLLAHRHERRFVELRNLVRSNTVQDVSVFRIADTVNRSTDMNTVLYKELDLCMWILGSRIATICTMKNGNVQNTIAKTENGIVCTIEIAATLKDGVDPVDKHEIITARGIACDKVVDTQIMQSSIYLFGEENKSYTDVDFELYGLSSREVSIVRQALDVARMENVDDLFEADSLLKKIIKKSDESAEKCERMVI